MGLSFKLAVFALITCGQGAYAQIVPHPLYQGESAYRENANGTLGTQPNNWWDHTGETKEGARAEYERRLKAAEDESLADSIKNAPQLSNILDMSNFVILFQRPIALNDYSAVVRLDSDCSKNARLLGYGDYYIWNGMCYGIPGQGVLTPKTITRKIDFTFQGDLANLVAYHFRDDEYEKGNRSFKQTNYLEGGGLCTIDINRGDVLIPKDTCAIVFHKETADTIAKYKDPISYNTYGATGGTLDEYVNGNLDVRITDLNLAKSFNKQVPMPSSKKDSGWGDFGATTLTCFNVVPLNASQDALKALNAVNSNLLDWNSKTLLESLRGKLQVVVDSFDIRKSESSNFPVLKQVGWALEDARKLRENNMVREGTNIPVLNKIYPKSDSAHIDLSQQLEQIVQKTEIASNSLTNDRKDASKSTPAGRMACHVHSHASYTVNGSN